MAWPGYRPIVRTCPTCGRENAERHLFCDDCGADLRAVPAATTAHGDPTRWRLLDIRARDRLQDRPRRRHEEGSGGGFIVLGTILFIAAIWMTTNESIRGLCWGASLLSIAAGFWRMRYDLGALSRTGLLLGGTIGGVLLLIASQSTLLPRQRDVPGISTPAGTVPVSTIAASATPTAGGSTVQGAVRMYRSDPAHTGQQPGPPPSGQPSLAWRFDTGGEVYASPAVAGGIVYVTSKSGFLYAVDAGTGEQRWRVQLGDYVVRSSPAVVDGVVYVGGGFHLIAVDAATGQERWRFPMRYAGQASPTVVGGTIYVASQEGFLYAVDARSGAERWHIQTEGLIFSSPAYSDGAVVVGTDAGVLYAVSTDGGRIRWRRNLDGPIFASPAIHDGTIYVTIGAGFTYALRAEDGQEFWREAVGGDEAPAITETLLIVSAKDGGVYGLDIATGATRWLFPTGEVATASPSVTGDLVFVGAGRNLFILDRADGTRRSYFLAGDTVESAPTVIGGRIFFGNRDGFLYALGTP